MLTIEDMERIQQTMEKGKGNRPLKSMRPERSGHDKRQTYERHSIKTHATLETLQEWIDAARAAGLT
jgi:hypothetical protein